MNDDELIQARGHIIHRMCEIEHAMDMIVGTYMFRGVITEFYALDMAANEHYSWALRSSVFERALLADDLLPKKDVDALISDLRRLASVRNLFAHAGRIITKVTESVPQFVHPKKSGAPLDFVKLVTEFVELDAKIRPQINTIFGIVTHKYPSPGVPANLSDLP